MIMSTETALARLVKLMRENRDKDAATIMEMWHDEIVADLDRHEQRAREQAINNPPLYGVMRMGTWVDVDAGGTFRERYVPKEKYRIREQDISAFAKEHHINERELREVLAGRRLEVGAYRSFDGPGLASRIYIDRSAKREQIEQLRQEEEQTAEHIERTRALMAARGRTPEEPAFIDWVPKGKK